MDTFNVPSDRGNGFEGGAASGAHCILLVHINGVLSEILLRVEYFRAYVARVFAFFIPYFYHYVLRVVQVSGKLHQLTFQNNQSELRAGLYYHFQYKQSEICSSIKYWNVTRQ